MDELQIHHNCLGRSQGNHMVPLGFQKNYPKNIFIPIIEHLSDLGFQELYQKCVGTRQLFEGKNVVSIAVIYRLLSQKWFTEEVDRANLLAIVCSKILLNSKIKKKIFHLKVAQILINSQIGSQRQFKTLVSKKVSSLATSSIEYDQFLSFGNQTIYLFHIITQVICAQLHMQPCHMHIGKSYRGRKDPSEDSEENQVNQSQMTSKQEFRMYLKRTLQIFNDQKYENGQLRCIYKKIQTVVAQKQSKFQQKYGLASGILNSNIFLKEIVEPLLNYKEQGLRITNLLLNQWIQNFKEGCLKSIPKLKQENKIVEQQFTHHEQNCSNPLLVQIFIPQKFTPYIITFPKYPNPFTFDQLLK